MKETGKAPLRTIYEVPSPSYLFLYDLRGNVVEVDSLQDARRLVQLASPGRKFRLVLHAGPSAEPWMRFALTATCQTDPDVRLEPHSEWRKR